MICLSKYIMCFKEQHNLMCIVCKSFWKVKYCTSREFHCEISRKGNSIRCLMHPVYIWSIGSGQPSFNGDYSGRHRRRVTRLTAAHFTCHGPSCSQWLWLSVWPKTTYTSARLPGEGRSVNTSDPHSRNLQLIDLGKFTYV